MDLPSEVDPPKTVFELEIRANEASLALLVEVRKANLLLEAILKTLEEK